MYYEMNNDYEDKDPLSDITREQIFNDPFWTQSNPTKNDWAKSLDYTNDYTIQYPLLEDIQAI